MAMTCIWWTTRAFNRCTVSCMRITRPPMATMPSSVNVSICPFAVPPPMGLIDRHFTISWSLLSGEFDADDSSNSKTFRSLVGDKKPGNNKDSLNATDKDIMVGERNSSQSSQPMHPAISLVLTSSHCCRCRRRARNKASRWARRFSSCCRSQRRKSVRWSRNSSRRAAHK